MSATTETVVATEAECASSPTVTARLTAVDALHWVSSALTSLARGLNDTPKIVALLMAGGNAERIYHLERP